MPTKPGGALIRKFVRGLFTVTVTAFDEDESISLSDYDDVTRQKIDDGDFVVFRVEATLWLLGHELATDHLGGCIYESPSQFMDHIGLRKTERELSAKVGRAIGIGSYFHDMVSTAIRDGRKEAIKLLPQLRRLQLRGAPKPDAIDALERLLAIGKDGVIERRETGKPTWSALEEVARISETALTKSNAPDQPRLAGSGNQTIKTTSDEQNCKAGQTLAASGLLAALEEMEQQLQAADPDETVQWAINELSDEGHAYLFGPRRKVLDAYKTWKAANENSKHRPA